MRSWSAVGGAPLEVLGTVGHMQVHEREKLVPRQARTRRGRKRPARGLERKALRKNLVLAGSCFCVVISAIILGWGIPSYGADSGFVTWAWALDAAAAVVTLSIGIRDWESR